MKTVRLHDGLVKDFKPIKSYHDAHGGKPITALDVDSDGEFAVTSGEDDAMRLFDLRYNACQVIHSKKYGCHLARFTNLKRDIVHASTKENHHLRYMSLTSNSYLRYFEGHEHRVCAIEMHPLEDLFLSGAENESLRLWDCRASNAQGLLKLHAGRPVVAWHPHGLVFAVAMADYIHLYDLRTFDKGRFAWIKLPPATFVALDETITALHFSTDGHSIVATSSYGRHCVFSTSSTPEKEAFSLRFQCGHHAVSAAAHQPSALWQSVLTADSRYLLSNEPQKGGIAVYALQNSTQITSRGVPAQPPSIAGDLVGHFHEKKKVGQLAISPNAPLIATYTTTLVFFFSKRPSTWPPAHWTS